MTKMKMIAFDAQTSGGILMSVNPDYVQDVLADLHLAGLTSACEIGIVTEKEEKYLSLDN